MDSAQRSSVSRQRGLRMLIGLLMAVPAVAVAAGVTLQVQHKQGMGRYLTDGAGMTLYRFARDEPGSSACRLSCLNTWLPVITRADPVAHRGVDSALLSTMQRDSGARHVTYGGWPLYRYARDRQPGATRGHGIDDFGARWYAVSPDGSRARPADPAPTE